MKQSICVDFDGVIHSYTSGWKGIDKITDDPVSGAFDALLEYLKAGYTVNVYSARSSSIYGINAMKEWFSRHGFKETSSLLFPSVKPPSILYIDDRGYHFTGTFPSVEYIDNFKPWNKQG